jgi:hypothetical protein
MENYSALSLIKAMPENKQQIASFIRSVKEELLSGTSNPIEIDVRLKILEEIVIGIRKDEGIKEQLVNELAKYPEKTVKLFGCEISKRNMTKYNYQYCNDSELVLLQAEADMAAQKLKERQELLKLIKPKTLVNPDTGEFLEPPLITTTESFSIKIL